MRKLLLITLILLALFGCDKKEEVDAKQLKFFAQAYAEEYLEKNNLYDEKFNYYLYTSTEFDYEYVYDYYLFCEDKCIAEVHLEYTEEPIYDGMSFKWNLGIITGIVIEDIHGDINIGSEKILLNDSIEMNYIKNYEIKKIEISEETINEMEQVAIEQAQIYLAKIDQGNDKFDLIGYVPLFSTYVSKVNKDTLVIEQSNVIDYVLTKNGEPVYIISFNPEDCISADSYDFKNDLNISFSDYENINKLFMFNSGRYEYSNLLLISNNKDLNDICLEKQECITFMTEKVYDKALEIIDSLNELKVIKSW